jgi:hypothetical protein
VCGGGDGFGAAACGVMVLWFGIEGVFMIIWVGIWILCYGVMIQVHEILACIHGHFTSGYEAVETS